MVTRRTLTLTDEQRTELLDHRDHDPRPQLRERCAALLRIAAGETPHAVAQDGILQPRDPDTVYGWLTCYQQGGVAALARHLQGGSRRGRLRSRSGQRGARAPAVPA